MFSGCLFFQLSWGGGGYFSHMLTMKIFHINRKYNDNDDDILYLKVNSQLHCDICSRKICFLPLFNIISQEEKGKHLVRY